MGRGLGRSFALRAVPIGKGSDLHLHRDGFILELVRRERRYRFPVRIHCKLVRVLTRNSEFPRDIFRAQPHIDVRVRIMIHQPRIRRNLVAAHRHQRHRFRAAGNNHLRPAASDPLRTQGNGL